MTLNNRSVYSKNESRKGGRKRSPVSHPDDSPDPTGTTRRRPSHFRKKTRNRAITRMVGPRSDVINQAPSLPEPTLQRPMPPPAPLPSESAGYSAEATGWLDDRNRRKRVEDVIGIVGLAILVAAMLVAMWLQMRQP